ncbi:MAG: carbohydrate ABC transporter permease [Oscillospiraceae bacterium]|nr:carbohydrate ABC transporter permease [Oscillospiraceae bacterium]
MSRSIAVPHKKYKLNRMNFVDVIIIAVLLALFVIILYPFYNSVLVSMVTQATYLKTRFMIFPVEFNWGSYLIVFNNGSLFNGMFITMIVTLLGTAYNMVLTITLAYAFTKEFIGKRFFLMMIIFTMYFSGGLVPFYLLIRDLQLIDNIGAMILPTGVSIMYMTIIRKQFESLPKELEESAKIDGASEMLIMFRIAMPLSIPILVTFSLYYGVERWNEWYYGMLFIRTFEKRPLQLVLRGIIQQSGMIIYERNTDMYDITPFSDGIKMACIVVTMTPIIAAYPFLQKYFVKGLTIGAVKG